jgi:hypothetical protein
MIGAQNVSKSKFDQLTHTVIKYLAQLGEAIFSVPINDVPNSSLIKVAVTCFDRIEHIAQYALENLDENFQLKCLSGDTTFLRSQLKAFEVELNAGRPSHYPSEKMLDELDGLLRDYVARISNESTKQDAWYWVRYEGLDGWIDWTPAQRQGKHWNSVGFRGIPMHEVEVGEELKYAGGTIPSTPNKITSNTI